MLVKPNLLLILIKYQIWNGQEPLNSTLQPLNMQFHTKPSRLHQTFLKKGGRWYGDKIGRKGGMEGSLVELEEKDKNCRHIIKKCKIQAVCTEKLKHYIVL